MKKRKKIRTDTCLLKVRCYRRQEYGEETKAWEMKEGDDGKGK